MAKNDNVHSIRLIDSLRRNIGNDVADEFEERYPLSKAAAIEKKYEWAKNVCDYLDGNYDTETIMTLRKECRCNDGKSIANKILKYLNGYVYTVEGNITDSCVLRRYPVGWYEIVGYGLPAYP